MRSQGGTKNVSFFEKKSVIFIRRRRRTSRFFFWVGMSEYAPKLIFDFKGILSTFSNHISSQRLWGRFCDEGRTKKLHGPIRTEHI